MKKYDPDILTLYLKETLEDIEKAEDAESVDFALGRLQLLFAEIEPILDEEWEGI